MSITSGFFHSVNGDRKYNARDISLSFKGVVPDGVFENFGGKLRVTAGNGMSVNVADGRAIIDCQWVDNTARETLTIGAATTGKTRIDAVVLRLDNSARAITLEVKQGTAAATSPAAPARTWNDTVKEIYLATVTVSSDTTAITQDIITDMRGTSLCPYITGLVDQCNTAEMFEMVQEFCVTALEVYKERSEDFFTTNETQFGGWLDDLIENNTVNTILKKYQSFNIYKGSAGYLTSVLMPLAQYENGVALFIHVGGILLVQGVDYSIVGSGTTARVTFKRALKDNGKGIPLCFTVVKNEIDGAIGRVGNTAIVIDHAPNVGDLTHTNTAFVQYDKDKKILNNGKSSLYNVVATFAETIVDLKPIIGFEFDNNVNYYGSGNFSVTTNGVIEYAEGYNNVGKCLHSVDGEIKISGIKEVLDGDFTIVFNFKLQDMGIVRRFGYWRRNGVIMSQGVLSVNNITTNKPCLNVGVEPIPVAKSYYDGYWHNYALKKCDDYISLTIDGTDTLKLTGLYGDDNSGDDLYIGDITAPLYGYIDRWKMYNRILTDEEINKALMRS